MSKHVRVLAVTHALELYHREIRELTPTAQADEDGLRFGIAARTRLDKLLVWEAELKKLLDEMRYK